MISEFKSNGKSLGLGWFIYDVALQLGLSLTGYNKYYLFSLERVILLPSLRALELGLRVFK